MAHFAVVAPPNILDELWVENVFGSTHLLLAHDVVDKPKRYAKFFPSIYGNAITILDNSVIETGGAASQEIIFEAADIVKPSCIVLPDVLLDGYATAKACDEAYHKWPQGQYKYMFVPQGRTLSEFIRCAESLADRAKYPRITWWGVPRNLVQNIGSRQNIPKLLHILNPYRDIHLLGFSDNLVDDVLAANTYYVTSIDSAVPLRLDYPMSLAGLVPPRGDWWENAKMNEHVVPNLANARKWFGDKRIMLRS